MNKYAIGNNIHKRLKERKETQHDFAKALGSNDSTVSHWMSGKHELRVSTLYRIAKYLNCTADELMEGMDE